MNSLLKLAEHTELAIDPQWGLDAFSKIMFNNKHGKDFFSEQKDQSKAVYFYDGNKLVGKDINEVTKRGTIAVLSISGVMTAQDGWCNVGMATYDKILRDLYSNENVSGIIIKFDSGGGYVDAGAILHNSIVDKNKPVVILSNFLGSAAVMASLGADEIIAQTLMSEFGSIGVYSSMSKEGLKWYKENVIDIYSSKSNDKNKGFRDAVNGDFSTLTKSVTRMDEQFMALVTKYRGITDEKTLSGGMFQTNEAKKRGLIDSIGSLNHALKRVNSLTKSKYNV